MNVPLFDMLLNLLKEKLQKNSMRKSIEPECRLAITLTYLSHGTSQQCLAWAFKMGRSTIHYIIEETCEVIWEVLHEFYVAQPNKTDYEIIAKGFEERWNLANCLGAIDGKHINIQCPPKSGSQFYNYKKDYSIGLLAVCDAQYIFTAVDVGAYGSQSDGGILEKNYLLENFRYRMSEICHRPLPSFRFFFIGDPAFPLKSNIMKAYPSKNLTLEQRIFNYRISRARVVIENSFGILVSRWRVLRSVLNCLPSKAEKIVLATIVLHNFIKLNESTAHLYCPTNYVDWEDDQGIVHLGEWRKDSLFKNINRKIGSNHSSRTANDLRETLKSYFNNEGAIALQQKIK